VAYLRVYNIRNMIFEASFNTHTWEFFAHSLYLLQNARNNHFKDSDDLIALNSAIILNCAVTTEGATKTYLLAKIRDSNAYNSTDRKKDRFTWSLVDRTIKEVENARSFEQLYKFSKEFYGENWNQLEGYKGIIALYHFRNILAHGSIVQYRNVFEAEITDGHEIDDRKEIEVGWNKNALMGFLFEKFKSLKQYKNDPWKIILKRVLFSNEIADFFLDNTKKFLSDMYSKDNTRKMEEAKHVVREIGVKSTPFVSLPNHHLLPPRKGRKNNM